MKIKLTNVLTVLLVVLFCCSCGKAPAVLQSTAKIQYDLADESQVPSSDEVLEDMMLITEKNGNKLFFDAETTRFAVTTAEGFSWFSFLNDSQLDDDDVSKGTYRRAMTSVLTVSACDKSGDLSKEYASGRDSVENGTYQVRYITEDAETVGFRIDFTFDDISFTVPVAVVLDDKGLTVHVVASEMKSEDKEYIVTQIGLLPFFASSSTEDNGYLFVPDGCGSIIRFNNGKTSVGGYDGKVYGADGLYTSGYTAMESIRLPVFGIGFDDTAAMLAVIESGDTVSTIQAEVAGINTNRNFVFNKFVLKSTDTYAIKDITGTSQNYSVIDTQNRKWQDFTLRYLFLNAQNSNYSSMASAYGSYYKAQNDIQPNQKNGKQAVIDFYGAVLKKEPVAGIPTNVTKVLTDFSEMNEILAELKENGLNDLTVRYDYFSKDKLNADAENDFAVIGKLGGVKGMKKFLRQNAEQDLYMTANFTAHTKAALESNKRFIQDNMGNCAFQYKTDLVTGSNNTGTKYCLLQPNYVLQYASDYIGEFRKYATEHLGIYAEEIGNSIYSSNGNFYFSREDAKSAYSGLLKNAAENKLKVMVNGGNAYALPYAAGVIDAPMTSNSYAITDYAVPFYQIAVGDCVELSGSAINLNSNPKKQFLRCIETGCIPHYVLIANDPEVIQETALQYLYGVNYQLWKEEIFRNQQLFGDFLDATQGSALISHEALGENLVKSNFKNGVSVIVNYADNDVQYENRLIKGLSFEITK